MAMKQMSDYPPYQGYYHLVGATKYRKKLFLDKSMRKRLAEIINEVIQRKDGVELVECAIAYDHVHILIKTSVNISNVGQVIFGASSRLIRKEYPILVKKIENGLWGGKTYRAIKDEEHLNNCESYIRRHLPDNTKEDDI